MKTIIKLNNYDLDILITEEFAKDIRIGDVLCVYDFDKEVKPDWVIEFIGDEYDESNDKFPVDDDYRENEGYLKLEISSREFRGEELIFWTYIWSNDENFQWK